MRMPTVLHLFPLFPWNTSFSSFLTKAAWGGIFLILYKSENTKIFQPYLIDGFLGCRIIDWKIKKNHFLSNLKALHCLLAFGVTAEKSDAILILLVCKCAWKLIYPLFSCSEISWHCALDWCFFHSLFWVLIWVLSV